MSTPRISALATPVPRSTLSEEVHARLRAAILNLELAPGTRLVEAQLARELGVSRAPVREALQQLLRTGLVAAGDDGYRVPFFGAHDIRELVQLRVSLERLAMRLVVQHRADAIVDQLAKTVRAMREVQPDAPDDAQRLTELDTTFHRQLCAASNNGRLLRIWDEMALQIKLAMVATNLSFSGRDGFAADHAELVALIADGDIAACDAAIEKHILAGLERYEALQGDGSDEYHGNGSASTERRRWE